VGDQAKKRVAGGAYKCSYEHMHDHHLIPPSVAECLAEIERSVQRFRSSYNAGVDPERLLTDEIITMRVELIRLWSEISSHNNQQLRR
jgi:hypothetical protein